MTQIYTEASQAGRLLAGAAEALTTRTRAPRITKMLRGMEPVGLRLASDCRGSGLAGSG